MNTNRMTLTQARQWRYAAMRAARVHAVGSAERLEYVKGARHYNHIIIRLRIAERREILNCGLSRQECI